MISKVVTRWKIDLRVRNLFWLFCANTISGFAQGITIISIPWYLVDTLGEQNGRMWNAVIMGSITFLTLFWGLFAGTLVDKLPRKRLFLYLNLGGMFLLLIATIIASVLTPVPIWLLAMVMCGTIFIFNIHYPNLYAFVQSLFSPHWYSGVNSLIEMQGQLTNFIGMSIGALLIAGTEDFPWFPLSFQFQPWKLESIFLLNSITYLIAILLILQIHHEETRVVPKRSFWNFLTEGLKYLKERPPLMIYGIASYMVFFATLVMYQVVIPGYVKEVLRASGAYLGFSEAFFALGAFLIGFIGTTWNSKIQRLDLIQATLGCLFLGGVAIGLMMFFSIPWFFLCCSFLFGIANASARVFRLTFLLQVIPNSIIGRTNAFFQVVNVLLRSSFMLLFAFPFFSSPDNDKGVIWEIMIIMNVLLLSFLLLLFYRNEIKQFKIQKTEKNII